MENTGLPSLLPEITLFVIIGFVWLLKHWGIF